MRIAVWHNLPSGGGKRALYNHIKALKERGHYIEAWTTDLADSSYLPISGLITEHQKSLKKEFENLNRFLNPISKENKKKQVLFKHYKECADEIRKGNFDLIFANSCEITYMPFIGLFTDIPKLLYLGEPYRPLYEAMPFNIWGAPYEVFRFKKIKRIIADYFLNYARRLMVRREIEAARSYDKILVNSLFSRENVIRSYGIDATVCYLGIDTELFINKDLPKEGYVVGLGSISHLKGVDRAIEIIGSIPGESRPALKWIANGTDPYFFQEMVKLAEIKQVEFQPYINISDEDLIGIVSKAAVMLYTSRLEPFGLAPLEANACGTYVIAIAEGGIRESISDGINGTLIKGFKLNDTAKVVESFTQNLEYAKKMGYKANIFVRQNWNKKLLSDNIIFEVEELVQKVNN